MVWGCGYNEDGMLGLEDLTNRPNPVRILRGANVQALACGYYHAFIGVLPPPAPNTGAEGATRDKPLDKCRGDAQEESEGKGAAAHKQRVAAGCAVGGQEEAEGGEGEEEEGEGGSGDIKEHRQGLANVRIHVGAHVRIVGLSANRQLNGQTGMVVRQARSERDGRPRVCVRIGSREVGVRPANLALI
jgi:hypothetical protein